MKRSFFTFFLVFFFYGFGAPNHAQASIATRWEALDKTKLKRNTVAICATLLTGTTSVAVVANNVSGGNTHKADWGGSFRRYRDRNGFILFLAKGLFGKDLGDEVEYDVAEDTQIVGAVPDSRFELNYSKIYESMSDEALSRQIVFLNNSRGETNPHSSAVQKNGLILIPGFVARFNITYADNGSKWLTIRNLTEDLIIFKGEITPKKKSEAVEHEIEHNFNHRPAERPALEHATQ